jgi:hypothetical protein
VEVTFRFQKDLVDRVRRKAEASGMTIEQVIVAIIERIAAGEELNSAAFTKSLLTPGASNPPIQSKHDD